MNIKYGIIVTCIASFSMIKCLTTNQLSSGIYYTITTTNEKRAPELLGQTAQYPEFPNSFWKWSQPDVAEGLSGVPWSKIDVKSKPKKPDDFSKQENTKLISKKGSIKLNFGIGVKMTASIKSAIDTVIDNIITNPALQKFAKAEKEKAEGLLRSIGLELKLAVDQNMTSTFRISKYHSGFVIPDDADVSEKFINYFCSNGRLREDTPKTYINGIYMVDGSYDYTFSSDFSTELQAKIAQFNSLVSIEPSLKFNQTTSRTISIAVKKSWSLLHLVQPSPSWCENKSDSKPGIINFKAFQIENINEFKNF